MIDVEGKKALHFWNPRGSSAIVIAMFKVSGLQNKVMYGDELTRMRRDGGMAGGTLHLGIYLPYLPYGTIVRICSCCCRVSHPE